MYDMKNLHTITPLIESLPISKKAGLKVLLKLENTQPVSSFKIRGLGLLCQRAKEEGKKCFVVSSGGNAGIAVAFAGRKLSVKTIVVVPSTTTLDTILKIKEQGAEVMVSGDVWDETDMFARELAKNKGGQYISPFDHPLIWEGHSSIIDELVQEIEKPDAIILSVGGGGLLCGIIQGLHNNKWQDVPVIAAETKGADSFSLSQQAGKLITLDRIDSIAKTLGAKTVAAQTLEWDKKHDIRSVVVSDKEAVSSCLNFANDHRFLVEPSCGASLAVAYEKHEILNNISSVVVVVCGGIAVDLKKLNDWMKQISDNNSHTKL